MNITSKDKKCLVTAIILSVFAISIYYFHPQTVSAAGAVITPKVQSTPSRQIMSTAATQLTCPLDIVANPSRYLNKRVVMQAKFDKFSTLGLDYSRANRSSQDYIGFLIQRPDVTDHNIPLSEMKLFLKRDYAEKFIELDTGDKIEISGKVFSDALGDPWIDIDSIVIKEKIKKASADQE